MNRIKAAISVLMGKSTAIALPPEEWEAETDAYWRTHTCELCGYISDATVEYGVCTRPNAEACQDRIRTIRRHAMPGGYTTEWD